MSNSVENYEDNDVMEDFVQIEVEFVENEVDDRQYADKFLYYVDETASDFNAAKLEKDNRFQKIEVLKRKQAFKAILIIATKETIWRYEETKFNYPVAFGYYSRRAKGVVGLQGNGLKTADALFILDFVI